MNIHYYIDRCELWGLIREINSGISHARYHFFPPELLLHNYKCIYCCVTVNTHTIVNWKKSVKCYRRLWNITNMTSYLKRKYQMLFGIVYASIVIKFN